MSEEVTRFSVSHVKEWTHWEFLKSAYKWSVAQCTQYSLRARNCYLGKGWTSNPLPVCRISARIRRNWTGSRGHPMPLFSLLLDLLTDTDRLRNIPQFLVSLPLRLLRSWPNGAVLTFDKVSWVALFRWRFFKENQRLQPHTTNPSSISISSSNESCRSCCYFSVCFTENIHLQNSTCI